MYPPGAIMLWGIDGCPYWLVANSTQSRASPVAERLLYPVAGEEFQSILIPLIPPNSAGNKWTNLSRQMM